MKRIEKKSRSVRVRKSPSGSSEGPSRSGVSSTLQESQGSSSLLLTEAAVEQDRYRQQRHELVLAFESDLLALEVKHRRALLPLTGRHGTSSSSQFFQSSTAKPLRIPTLSPLMLVDKTDVSILGELCATPPLKTCSVGGFRCTMQAQSLEGLSEDDPKYEATLVQYSSLPQHPNIVRYLFHSYVEQPPALHVFTESVQSTLETFMNARMAASRPFSPPEILQIVLSVATGVQFLNQNGIIHRNLSPQAIFFDHDPLLNFSRVAIGSIITAKASRTGQAVTNFGFGPYTAPEIYTSNIYEAYNYDVDTYSLAMLLYLLLALKVPWGGIRDLTILQHITQGKRPELPPLPAVLLAADEAHRGIYEVLYEVYDECSRIDPSSRPPINLVRQALLGQESLKGLLASTINDSLTRLQGKDIGGFELANRTDAKLFEQFVVIGTSPLAPPIPAERSVRHPEVLYVYPPGPPMDPILTEITFPNRITVHKAPLARLSDLMPSKAEMHSSSRSFIVRLSSDSGNYYVFCVRDFALRHVLPLPWHDWVLKYSTANHRNNAESFDLDLKDHQAQDSLHASDRIYLFISRFPFCQLFFSALYEIQRTCRHTTTSSHRSSSVAHFLQNLAHVSLPPERESLSFQLSLRSKTPLSFEIPQGPRNKLLAQFAFPLLFRTLSVSQLLDFWLFLLVEQKIVIQSSNPGLLSALCFSVLPLMTPFCFQGIFFPIVPRKLQILCDSPVPFLFGFCGGTLPRLDPDVAIFNLDAKKLYKPPSLLQISIPSAVAAQATTFITNTKNEYTLDCSDSYIRSASLSRLEEDTAAKIVSTFKSFHETLLMPLIKHIHTTDECRDFYRNFERHDFIMDQVKSENPETIAFYKLFSQTQSFAFWLQAEFSETLRKIQQINDAPK